MKSNNNYFSHGNNLSDEDFSIDDNSYSGGNSSIDDNHSSDDNSFSDDNPSSDEDFPSDGSQPFREDYSFPEIYPFDGSQPFRGDNSHRGRRTYIRLTVFCAFFAALAVSFGIAFTAERGQRELESSNRLAALHGELCGLLGNIGETLDGISDSDNDENALRLSSLCGAAKNTAAALPLDEIGRSRLQSYFTAVSDYALRLVSDDNTADAGSITAYAALYSDYARLMLDRFTKIAGENGEVTAGDISSVRIDSPPEREIEQENGGAGHGYAVGEAQAKSAAKRLLGSWSMIRRITSDGLVVRYGSGAAFVDISRYGGNVIRYSAGGVIGDGIFSLDIPDAVERAEKFLASISVSGCVLKSFAVSDSRLELLYERGGKTAQLAVSLENGRVVYFDASRLYG